jgi:hypothetical protein
MKKLLLTLAAVAAGGILAQAQTLFDYQTAVLAQSPAYYFTFDFGGLSSIVGSATLSASPAGVASQLGPDVFGNPGNSFYFTANNDVLIDANEVSDHLINGGGTATTNSSAAGSITFLFKTIDPGPQPGNGTAQGQHFIFTGGGAVGTSNGLALFIDNPSAGTDPSALKLRFGDGTTTLITGTNLVPDSWYYFALTYTEAPVTNKAAWYVGRLGGDSQLLSGVTSNLLEAVAGDAVSFYIGGNSNFTSNLRNPGNGQVDEVATWNRRLSATEIQSQFVRLPNAAVAQRAGYQSVISQQSPVHYFKLDGSPADAASPIVLNTNGATPAVGYSYDYFGAPGGSAWFSIGTDALVVNSNLFNGGGTATGSPGPGKGSVSCLFRSLASTNVQGQRWVFSAGGSGTASNAFGLFFENLTGANPASLKIRFGESSTVLLSAANIQPSTWYYFAATFDETLTNHQVVWWLGRPAGTLQSGQMNAAVGSVAGQGNIFVMGNHTNFNAGLRNSTPSANGQVDEYAIWNRVLATNEVAAQFAALLTPAPTLNIARSGTNVLLSWPASTPPAYVLESTPSVSEPAWSAADLPVISGNQYVVTNAVVTNAQFYRLNKP